MLQLRGQVGCREAEPMGGGNGRSQWAAGSGTEELWVSPAGEPAGLSTPNRVAGGFKH